MALSPAAIMATNQGNRTDWLNNSLSNRNLVINGAMQVWQRGTASTNVTSTPMYLADRWECRAGEGSTHTVIQSTDVPTSEGDGKSGFAYSLKFTVGSSAGTISAGTGNNYFNYKMEGRDFYHAKWGTAQAKTITLSFWVKSSVIGDYGLMFGKDLSQTYSTKYTISSANTWEKKTITVTGPSSGTWQNDNNISLRILWNWGAGSNYTTSTLETWGTDDNRGGYNGGSAVQLVTNPNATWYITGVQVEIGDSATSFEHRTAQDELLRCQRYFYMVGGESGGNKRNYIVGRTSNTNAMYCAPPSAVPMRSTPTVGNFSGSFNINCINKDGATNLNTQPVIDTYNDGKPGNTVGNMYLSGGSGLTDGRVCCARINTAITFDSEIT